jgi:hypothetical protein
MPRAEASQKNIAAIAQADYLIRVEKKESACTLSRSTGNGQALLKGFTVRTIITAIGLKKPRF